MTDIHDEPSKIISEDLITAEIKDAYNEDYNLSTSDYSQKSENDILLTNVEIYDAQN